MPGPPATRLVRFGVFAFDQSTGDLWKAGRRIRLQEQPRQVLCLLLAEPGVLVTRDALQAALWRDDTFVDFDTGLNVVVTKLRQALGDSANAPRFIETLPRRGYRFVAPVAPAVDEPRLSTIAPEITPQVGPSIDAGLAPQLTPDRSRRRWQSLRAILAMVTLVSAVALWWVLGQDKTSGTSRVPRAPTVAVLPFDNLSGDQAEDYFADGMTEALIVDLTSIRGMNVIARQSTKQYKGSDKSVSAIAADVGADTVIQGSIFRSAERVRLSVQLIDAKTDRQLWAQAYEHDRGDVLQLQREAAQEVARHIAVVLTPGERTRLGSVRRVNPAAYDAYLQGRSLLVGTSESDAATTRARAEFQRAIDLDPTFAPAYVGIAEVEQIRGTFMGGRPPLETRPLAFRAVRRALELDPDLGEAHAMMARLQLSEFDWDGADRSFVHMLELSPGNASGLVWYAYALLLKGRIDEALDVARRAESLDPLDLNTRARVGFVNKFARRHEEAVKRYRAVLALDARNINASTWIVESLDALGRKDEALAAARGALDRLGRSPLTLHTLASAEGRVGNRFEAVRLIDELLALSLQQYVSPSHLAMAYAGLGDRDRAFEWFERAYEERSNQMMYYPIAEWFNWAPDPRYLRLVSKVRQPHRVRDGS